MAWVVKLLRQTLEVGESGRKSDRSNYVFSIAVKFDDFGYAEFFGNRQRLKVGTIIDDGDDDAAALQGFSVAGFIELERGQVVDYLLAVSGMEMHSKRIERRDDINELGDGMALQHPAQA